MRRGFWLRVAESVVRPLVWVFTKAESRGYEHIPASGPAILAVNHISYADPMVIARYVFDRPREIRFLAKSSLFNIPVLGFLMRRLEQIPVHRASRDAEKALHAAVERLRSGEAPIVYPEGTCTKEPALWPMRGKTGVARLWYATGAPVIPIAQWGAQRIHHPVTNRVRLRVRTPVVVSAGPPVDLSAFVGTEPTAERLKEVTEVIMRRLRDDVAALRGEPAPTGPLYVPPPPGSALSPQVRP